MLIFYVETILDYILSLYARLNSNRNKTLQAFFVILVIATLFLISGFRTNIGDTESYIYLYKLIGSGYVSNGGYEAGFVLFFRILKSISTDPQFMIFVSSLIITACNIWTIKKYPSYFELATFMYITSGYYLVTMNGIRQSMAAAILFACTGLIIKGNFKCYLAVVILMTTIHSSAIILIPVYFIVRNEAWSKRIYILMLIFLVLLIMYNPMMKLVFSVLGNSKYAEYQNFKEGGANILRVAVFAVPVVLSFIKKDQLREKWPESSVFVNMSLICFISMCFSLSNWIFARFTIYFEAYNFILLAFIIGYCTTKKERRFLYFGLILAYSFFFWYEQAFTLHMDYETNLKLL